MSVRKWTIRKAVRGDVFDSVPASILGADTEPGEAVDVVAVEDVRAAIDELRGGEPYRCSHYGRALDDVLAALDTDGGEG